MPPKKPQYSPHKHNPIEYSAKQQIVQPTDSSPSLDDKSNKIVQVIVGALLYVVRAVNNKLLVVFSAVRSQ